MRALPSTRSISMEQVRTELKRTGTISLNDTDVRKLAGRTSGTISMADLRGKKASESVTNYKVYSNTWTGWKVNGNFSFNFPHKVISGKCTLTRGTGNRATKGTVTLLGVTLTRDLRTITVDIPTGTSVVNGSYYTDGYDNPSSPNKTPYPISIDVEFTGEWEV